MFIFYTVRKFLEICLVVFPISLTLFRDGTPIASGLLNALLFGEKLSMLEWLIDVILTSMGYLPLGDVCFTYGLFFGDFYFGDIC